MHGSRSYTRAELEGWRNQKYCYLSNPRDNNGETRVRTGKEPFLPQQNPPIGVVSTPKLHQCKTLRKQKWLTTILTSNQLESLTKMSLEGFTITGQGFGNPARL